MTVLADSTAGTQRRLTIVLDGRRFVMAAEAVREVILRPVITRVPHGPAALTGVCNLRGTVLPVISLARLMNENVGTEERIVVLDHGGGIGVLVDAVTRLDAGAEATAQLDGQAVDLPALLDAAFKSFSTQRSVAPGAPRRAESEPAAPETQQRVLLTFLVNGQTFALPLTAVSEALRVPTELARVVRADPTVLGVAHVRDRSLPMLSIAGLLGFGDAGTRKSSGRVLVVDHDGVQLGLVVDSIEAILRLDEAAIDPVPDILRRGKGNAELDAIGRPGQGRPLVSILSVSRLFANAPAEATAAAKREENRNLTDPSDFVGEQEQFVLFDLGPERYGLPIAAVSEVIRLPDHIARLPNGPKFVRGIINLRGRAVPIIDQRQRFDAPAAPGKIQPRVIIVTVGELQAGFVVDAVSEILSVASDDIAATPALASERSAVFSRVATIGHDRRLILLIDPQEMLSRAEQDLIAELFERQARAEAS